MKSPRYSTEQQIPFYENLSNRIIWKGSDPYWKRSNKLAGNVRKYRRIQSWISGEYFTVFAHRLKWFMEYGYIPKTLDHINGNKLDNRIDNLREVTIKQNNINRQKIRGVSRFKGVSLNRSTGKWVAHIKVNGKSMHLGTFKTEVEAGEAYDKSALTRDSLRSSTKSSFRGKGLPFILDQNESGVIRNLKIVTNRAIFDSEQNHENHNSNFNGTLLVWDVFKNG